MNRKKYGLLSIQYLTNEGGDKMETHIKLPSTHSDEYSKCGMIVNGYPGYEVNGGWRYVDTRNHPLNELLAAFVRR